MSQLEELKRQRKELDAKIKELENTEIVCGNVKYDGTYISVLVKRWDKDCPYNSQWKKIIYPQHAEAKSSLYRIINDVNRLLNDLQSLYEKMK